MLVRHAERDVPAGRSRFQQRVTGGAARGRLKVLNSKRKAVASMTTLITFGAPFVLSTLPYRLVLVVCAYPIAQQTRPL